MTDFAERVSSELNIQLWQVTATKELLTQEATVPFIARYRKEATGGLDEVQVLAIRDRLQSLTELSDRRESIFKSLDERKLLTEDLKTRLLAAETMSTLEDIYLPFRPKRRTRAVVARERGLEPLAQTLLEQNQTDDPIALGEKFVDPKKEINNTDEALAGARDIIAETISEDEKARKLLRELFEQKSVIRSRVSTGQEEKGAKFRDYFDWSEDVAGIPSHRFLAMRRGEAEGVLNLSLRPDSTLALDILNNLFVKNDSAASAQVSLSVADSYKRLLSLSLETELRLSAKKKADREAIMVFASNLTELLMAAPLGGRAILAIDPGFRTGCKAVALSAQGNLLEYQTIQPHASDSAREAAGRTVCELITRHKLTAVAIGNGTAGRETEEFVKTLKLDSLPIVMVNESGASIYSASEEAREEFAELDLTIRGAISIGRRLMDPLAELVKLDPKSIGVGQYQHDVNQGELKNSLDDVVISCVNRVGVEANTASEKLLSYVSGLGPGLAKNIIKFRQENGPFTTRQDFLKVPRLGPKAFEQCAGFLRLNQGQNPLDRSAVHPESYFVVESMAKDLGVSVADLLMNPSLRGKVQPSNYVTDKIGLPTLTDIMAELEKPGRDPRKTFKPFSFAEGLTKLEDMMPGQRLPGRITNVTAFGAFVDVGVHQDGLVHVSEMADRFIKSPSEVVKVGQEVTVTVLEVDLARKRLSLSLKTKPTSSGSHNGSGGQKSPEKNKLPRPNTDPGPFNNPFAVLKRN